MKRNLSTLIVGSALLVVSLGLAACDGTASAAMDAGLTKPSSKQPAETEDSALARLASSLQVFELVGTAESIGPDAWTVAGVTFSTGKGTEIQGQLNAGDLVKVEVALLADGQLFAREIQRAILAGPNEGLGELEFVGILESIGETQWMVNGLALQVGPGTEFKTNLQPGDLVKVHAVVGEGGILTAREIEPTTDDHPDDSSDRVGEFEFVGLVESMDGQTWTVGGQQLALVAGSEIDDQIAVGSLVKVHTIPQPDGSLVVREIELAGSDDSQDDSNHSGISDFGDDFEFVGVVEAMADGSWTIGGLTFIVTEHTELDSHILVGEMVKVELVRNADGTLTAKEIEKDDNSSSFDSNDLDNCDDDDCDDDCGSSSSGSGNDYDDCADDDCDDDDCGSDSGSGNDDDDDNGSKGSDTGEDDD